MKMKGYEILSEMLKCDPQRLLKNFEGIEDNDIKIGLRMAGCPCKYGLDDYLKTSEECKNGLCGKCWKDALNKEYGDS